MAKKDERGMTVAAPVRYNNPATASLPRIDDDHRGPAVADAYELSRCRIDLMEISRDWPLPENLPPLMLQFAERIPEDQRQEWLRTQVATEEVANLISCAMRSGELPIWVAPQDGPERLVAPSAMLEVDSKTIISGCYRPPNDRGWLYGRPLFVRRGDWTGFAARINSAKKLTGRTDKVQTCLTEAQNRQWLRLSKAVRILHRILRTRLAGQEPAPWINPPADPFDADCANATHRHRRTARTSLTMRRAMLSGELTAHLVGNDESVPLPGWAWGNESASGSAFNFNWLPLNPLQNHGLQEFGDWRCFVSRAEFKVWVANPEIAGFGDLPTLPVPFDQNLEPDQLSHREPPEKPFIELTQALTWIAFAVSLSRDEFSFMESCRFGPFAQVGWPDDLRAAMSRFSDQASAGNVRVRGRYITNYSDHSAAAQANTDYLLDTQLRDFAYFDSLYGGLERGSGLLRGDSLLEHALEGRRDGWRDVEVDRAELLNVFPPSEATGESAVAVTSTAGAESECRDWLTREFATDPERQRTKTDFRIAALAVFQGRLSDRGFNLRVWPALAQQHGRDGPGAKKKS